MAALAARATARVAAARSAFVAGTRSAGALGGRRFSTSTDLDDDDFGGYSLKLSDEQTALKELAREFALKEMIPVAAEYDRCVPT